MANFYDNFVKYSVKMGLAPSAAAEQMGYQRSVITRWKQGAEPRQATLQRVADFFGCTPDDLVAEEVKETDILQVRQTMRERPDLRTLWQFASQLPPSKVYEAIAMVAKMKEDSNG